MKSTVRSFHAVISVRHAEIPEKLETPRFLPKWPHIQHTDGRHIKHARTEGIQHTINVLIPDSARRPENSENNSCAREARPNFEFFFLGKKFIFICILPVKFCVSNFVFQLADSHGNIRFSGKTAIYADFS